MGFEKNKRAAKRYAYNRAAVCNVNAEKVEVQVLNISASGIQFASKTDLQIDEPIILSWKDSRFGSLEPTVVIARKEKKDFQFYYGTQYCNLSEEAKKSLVTLLKGLKETFTMEIEADIEKITIGYLFEVIGKGSKFLADLFKGIEKTVHFNSIVAEIKDYEKDAFRATDPVSICVQQLTTENFHCNILNKILSMVIEKGESRIKFFQTVVDQLKLYSETEAQTVKAVDAAMQANPNADRINMQKMVNESSNRLFYNAQSLLQAIVQAFGAVDSDSEEFNDLFGKILNEFKKTLTHEDLPDDQEQLTYKRRTKKPDENAKAEEVMEVPAFSEKRPRYGLWFAGFIFIVMASGFGAFKYFEFDENRKVKASLDLPIQILSFQKKGVQIDVHVDKNEWIKATPGTQKSIEEKLIRFAQRDRVIRTVLLLDARTGTIKTLYENMLPAEETAR